MFRHDDVPEHSESIAPPDALQAIEEDFLQRGRSEVLTTAVATPGKKVGLFGALISFEPEWHQETVTLSRAFDAEIIVGRRIPIPI